MIFFFCAREGEVLVLMEAVTGGNIVDLMNKRKFGRFQELEILGKQKRKLALIKK
jgi:hypothetical protein